MRYFIDHRTRSLKLQCLINDKCHLKILEYTGKKGIQCKNGYFQIFFFLGVSAD